jgi:hypothetical protein
MPLALYVIRRREQSGIVTEGALEKRFVFCGLDLAESNSQKNNLNVKYCPLQSVLKGRVRLL